MADTADARLGIGLIGCGDIAPAHVRAAKVASAVRLVTCMDVVESSARSLAEPEGIPYTTDVAELLAHPEVDAVTIATPAYTHADLTEQAASAGKAVVCEKPIAARLGDADRMIAACKRAGVALATCFPLRYGRGAVWMRDLVRAGALGKVIEVRLHSLSEKKPSYWTGGFSGRTQTEWRKSKAQSGGGVVITNLIHNIDLTRVITGLEVTRASAESGTFCTDVEVEDLALACLRFGNGAIGLVEGSSCFYGRDPGWDVAILGTKGQGRSGLFGPTEVFLTEEAEGLPAREWVRREEPEGSDPRAAFYDEFAAAVRAGSTPPITGEDGRKALEVVLAIYRAAETGAPVALPL